MLIALSTLVLIIIGLGLFFRHRPKIHIPCMLAAFSLDFGLLLAVEFTHHALEIVGQTLLHTTPSRLLSFHVTVSALVLVLYPVMLLLGIRLLKRQEAYRVWHRRLAVVFLLCRLANYVTSFFVGTHLGL